MLKSAIGIFIVLHGLVHLWYVTLSLGLVESQAEMGWTGNSWLLSGLLGDATTRSLAGAAYILATIAFVAAGIGILVSAGWWRLVLVGSAVFSSAVIVLFWDGSVKMPVEKGMLGLLVSMVILMAVLVFQWPSTVP